jgi:hypothetical protein
MNPAPNVRNAARPVAQIGTLLETDFPELFPKKPIDQLTASQSAAWDRLGALCDVFDTESCRAGTIKPRLIPLVIGPSGAGKSWLVRMYARACGRPLLRINARDWRPKGARGGPPVTYDVVAAFVGRHHRGIIHIDELEKMGTTLQGEWSASCLTEAFDLLDRTFLSQHPEHSERLETGMFLIGSGTWQDAWRGSAAKSIGFTANPGSLQDRVRGMKIIPEELLFRFGDTVILAPPKAAELVWIAEAGGLCALARDLGVTIDFEAGEQSALGVRWLEVIAADLHIKKRASVLKVLRDVAYD